MKESTLTRLFMYMEQNQYFIGNDLLAKYKELKEEEEFTDVEPGSRL